MQEIGRTTEGDVIVSLTADEYERVRTNPSIVEPDKILKLSLDYINKLDELDIDTRTRNALRREFRILEHKWRERFNNESGLQLAGRECFTRGLSEVNERAVPLPFDDWAKYVLKYPQRLIVGNLGKVSKRKLLDALKIYLKDKEQV